VHPLKVLLLRIETRRRSPLLRADEHRDRRVATETLQAAIDRAAEALPKATTDEKAIERFTEDFELTTIWKVAAEEVKPLSNPVTLWKEQMPSWGG
jgi:alkylation response protein AidB-like acyl-CoA dehydrogenase